jgi:hypothetical protein
MKVSHDYKKVESDRTKNYPLLIFSDSIIFGRVV